MIRRIKHRRPGYNKFHAKKTIVNGITFDSRKEARRYQELKLMERADSISSLELQVPFAMYASRLFDRKPIKVGKWIADFRYCDNNGAVIIEDAKGVRTATYRLKKKIIEAVYGFKIREV